MNSLAAKVIRHKVLLGVRLPRPCLGREELQIGRTLKSELVVKVARSQPGQLETLQPVIRQSGLTLENTA